MADIVVKLGDFEFKDFEVPERLPFGGAQMLNVHRLPGGARVIQAMGPDERPIRWSGQFRGPEALSRARTLDAMRVAGNALSLTWGDFAFTVVVAEFEPDQERPFEIPYRITCEVVSNDGAPLGVAAEIGIDEMIAADMAKVSDLGNAVGDGPLTGLISTLDTEIGKVSTFANAAQSTINGVLGPLADVQARVTTLLASAQNTVGDVATLGGVLPGNAGGDLASGLLSQLDAATASSNLSELGSLTGRMSKNFASIAASGAEVLTAGGDLYKLAADAYGDASEWATIARVNGLTDPVVDGLKTILVPPASGDTQGVLTT